MSDLIYVGPPTQWLPKFKLVADCGPPLDGVTRQPSVNYTNVGVQYDEAYSYIAVVPNCQLVPVAEFDAWREQQALQRLAVAAALIQDDLLVDFRVQAVTVVARPREG